MKALLDVIGFGYVLLVLVYFVLKPRVLVQPESKIAAAWKPLLIFSLILIAGTATILYVGLFMMG
jgi:hypothetical protein